MRIYEKQTQSSNYSPFKTTRSSIDSNLDVNQGGFKDEIRRLQDLIRKSQIEKAELDLKLTQAQNREIGKDSPSVTKMLYQENRDLRKQIRELREMIGNIKVDKKTSDEVMKSISPIRTTGQDLRFKEKFLELKGILFREKVKSAKKISTLMFLKVVAQAVIPVKKNTFDKIKVFRTSETFRKPQTYKTFRNRITFEEKLNESKQNSKKFKENQKLLKKVIKISSRLSQKKFFTFWKSVNLSQKFNFLSNLLRKVFNYHLKNSLFSTAFNSLKLFSLSQLVSEKTNEISSKNEKILKFQIKRKEIKTLQKQLITSIFIKNLRRILGNKCRDLMKLLQSFSKFSIKKVESFKRVVGRKSKISLLTNFNAWKHKILDMNINDLCKLHEEQRLEKDYLIEQFELIRVENGENIEKKFKLSALKRLKTIKNYLIRPLKQKSLFHWYRVTKSQQKKQQSLKNLCNKLVSPFFKLKLQTFFLITQELPTENSKNHLNPKILEKIAFNKFSLLKKAFQMLSVSRLKSKLKRKYLEKFLKMRKTKEKLLYFREFYKNCRFRLFKSVKDESLLMTKTNQFLEESLFAANSMIQESGLVLGAFERRMLNKSLKLALAFSQKKIIGLKGEFFNKWKKFGRCFKKNIFGRVQDFFFQKALIKAKTFYKWKSIQIGKNTESYQNNKEIVVGSPVEVKIIKKNEKFSKDSLKIIKMLKSKGKELTGKCFQSWKIFRGFSEFVEMMETEKYENFCYKVSAVLMKCKMSKYKTFFSHWIRQVKKKSRAHEIFFRFSRLLKEKVAKKLKTFIKSSKKIENMKKKNHLKRLFKVFKGTTLKNLKFFFDSVKKTKVSSKVRILERISNLINKKTRENLKSSFFILSFFGLSHKKPKCFKNLEKLSKLKIFLKVSSYFNRLKINVMSLKTSSLQNDCEELLRLADYSEHLIDEQEQKLQKSLKIKKSYKSTVKVLIVQKQFTSLKSRIFSLWKSRTQVLKSKLKNLFKIFKKKILKNSFKNLKKPKNSENFPETLIVESPIFLRIPQDSIEFEVSDPSILPFNYKKLTPSFDQKDFPLKVLKFLVLQKEKRDKLSAWFIWSRLSSKIKKKSIKNDLNEFHQFLRKKAIKALLNSLLTTKRLTRFSFIIWKKSLIKTCRKSQKTKKNPEYQEIIKKLLHENMNMAYKLSSAQVASKNFMKITNDLCSSNKENNPKMKPV